MTRRYLLLLAGVDLSDADIRELQSSLEERFREVKVIGVQGNPRAVIVRAKEPSARALRGEGEVRGPGGVRLVPVLSSGVIGKLKRRAAEARDNGKIHE